METQNLKTRLRDTLTEAIRAQDTSRLPVLRAAMTEVSKAETSGKSARELSDSDIVAVLTTMRKQRLESASIYETAGESERAATERSEVAVLETFLPATLDEAATRSLVEQIAETANLRPPFEPRMNGIVMGQLKKRDDIDKALAARLVREVVESR